MRPARPGSRPTSSASRRVYFDANLTPDVTIARATRASGAVPLVFAPVEINGDLFVDGGLLKNLPYDAFDATGHPTLALSIRGPTASENADDRLAIPTFAAYFSALLETLTFGEGSSNCMTRVRGVDVVELRAPPDDVDATALDASAIDFHLSRDDKSAMIRCGYAAVAAWLAAAGHGPDDWRRRLEGLPRGRSSGDLEGRPRRPELAPA